MYNPKLYTDLKSFFRNYVETDETEIGMLALYGTATHFYKNYQAFPILHITGDYATGKNRRLDLLNGISLNPIILTSPSLPSLFRSIDEDGCTILIDEADGLLRYSQFVTFLLTGYNKGGKVARVAKDEAHPKGFRPVYFEVYCPKILVTREGIQSEPLNSRTITIITSPKSEDSIIPNMLPADAEEEGKELRKKVESLVGSSAIGVTGDFKLGLANRDAQIFECLKDVALLYGEEAVEDLKNFVDHIYMPEIKYNTMFSFHEDLIRVLDECWQNRERAYLQTLQERLKLVSVDHADTTVKRIGKALRSLKFEIDNDNKLTYVIPNSKLLEIWRKRYLTDIKPSESSKLDLALLDKKSEDASAYNGEGGVVSVVKTVIGDPRHRRAREIVAKALSRFGSRRRNR